MKLLNASGSRSGCGLSGISFPAGRSSGIAIVRALCMKPDVMLFDEPTSALP